MVVLVMLSCSPSVFQSCLFYILDIKHLELLYPQYYSAVFGFLFLLQLLLQAPMLPTQTAQIHSSYINVCSLEADCWKISPKMGMFQRVRESINIRHSLWREIQQKSLDLEEQVISRKHWVDSHWKQMTKMVFLNWKNFTLSSGYRFNEILKLISAEFIVVKLSNPSPAS